VRRGYGKTAVCFAPLLLDAKGNFIIFIAILFLFIEEVSSNEDYSDLTGQRIFLVTAYPNP